MANLVLDPGRSHTLVTTVVQVPGRRGRAQLDLYLPGTDLRSAYDELAPRSPSVEIPF